MENQTAEATEYKAPELRLKLKMKILEKVGSQTALAQQTSLTEWEVSRIVRGWLNPSEAQLAEICKVLGVKDPNDLMT